MSRRSRALFLAVLLGYAAGVCQDRTEDIWGPNLIQNSGFEDGLMRWEAIERKGTVRFGADTEEKSEGQASAYVDAGDTGTVTLVQTIRVQRGGVYRFVGFAKSDGGSADAGVRLRCFDQSGKRLQDLWPFHLPAWRVPWRRYEEILTVPGPTAAIEVGLAVRGGGRAQFDGLYLGRRKPYPTADKLLAEQGWAFLSDLAFQEERGTVIRDAQTPRWRGREPLRLNSTIYEKGIGVGPNSTIVLELAGAADIFRALVGVDDEAPKGSVRFRVYGDKELLFDSGEVRGGERPRAVDLDVSRVTQLRLVVDDARDGGADDCADWCDAILLRKNTPAPPSSGRIIARPVAGVQVQRIKTACPIWTLTVCDLDGNGEEEIILGGADGMVSAVQPDGKVIWQNDVGGIPIAMDCGDVDGDGRMETAVCSLDKDGGLHLIDFEGKTVWSFSIPDVFFSAVTLADLKNEGKAKVIAASDNRVFVIDASANLLWQKDFGEPRVGCLAAGDVKGDSDKEIIVGFRAQWMRAAALSSEGEVLWTFSPSGIKGTMNLSTVRIADLNSDGREEIVFGASPATVLAVDGDGELLWKREKVGIRAAQASPPTGPLLVEVADFWADRAGLETVVLGPQEMRMLDRDGNETWQSESKLLLLGCSVGRKPVVGAQPMYVPSSGPRDEAVYALRFVAGGENQLATYPVEDPIGKNLDELRLQLVSAAPLPGGAKAKKTEKFHVLVAVRADLKTIIAARDALKKREGENLEFVPVVSVKDLPVEPQTGAAVPQENILDLARQCEQNDAPFFLQVDHDATPWVPLETAEKALAAAPRSCRGFCVSEDNVHYPSKKWDDFVEWTVGLMDLCLKQEKKVVLKEMYDCWAFLPADPQVMEKVFQPKYRSVIVPVSVTRDTRAPDHTVAGMIGLQVSGCVESWGIAAQTGCWSWGGRMPVDYAAICPPDVIFRTDLCAALLGATYFCIEGGEEFLEGDFSLSGRALRHRDLFHEALRRNVILPIHPRRVGGISAVSVARSYNVATSQQPMCGQPDLRSGPLRSGLLGIRHPLQTVEDDYLSCYAYRAARYMDGLFPQLPYGLIPIVPARAMERSSLKPSSTIQSDGDDVLLDGKTLSALDAKKKVLARLKDASAGALFSAEECFLSAHDLGGEYRVYLMDAACLTPRDKTVTLKINVSGRNMLVTDLITSDRIEYRDGQAEVVIPAGTFRAVSVRVGED